MPQLLPCIVLNVGAPASSLKGLRFSATVFRIALRVAVRLGRVCVLCSIFCIRLSEHRAAEEYNVEHHERRAYHYAGDEGLARLLVAA